MRKPDGGASVTTEVAHGSLTCASWEMEAGAAGPVKVSVDGRTVPCEVERKSKRVVARLKEPVKVMAGSRIVVEG
jgi:hypothetical protein